jgi:hypothetical protein
MEMSDGETSSDREVPCSPTSVVDRQSSQDQRNLEPDPGCGSHYYDQREEFPMEALKEGCHVLFDEYDEGEKVYIARRKVEIVGPMGCEHQPTTAKFNAVTEKDQFILDDKSAMIIMESKEDGVPTVLLCKGCARKLRGERDECRDQGRGDDVTNDEEGYCFATVRFWENKTQTLSLSEGVDVSQRVIRKQVYEELCYGEDVLYIGRVRFSIEAANKGSV